MIWEIGQTVTVVRPGYRSAKITEEKITKIGKRWVYLDQRDARFDKAMGALDGFNYGSPGSVYRSREQYEDATRADKMWAEFRRRLSWARPMELTAVRIGEIAAELGVVLE